MNLLHDVPPGTGLDFIALGAMVIRVDPGVVPFASATEYRVHVSGGEFNVAANMAACFGLRTGIVSATVDYPLGRLVEERVRAVGVTSFYKRFAHDDVRGPNIAMVFSDRGFGVRAPTVFYNRANEAAALLRPGDFDWTSVFDGGVRWFHSGGIFASLSDTTADLIIEGMQAAHTAGAVVSFDLNYRARLWRAAGGERRAQRVLRRIVTNADILVGNEEDLQMGLGLPGPSVAAASRLDPSAFARTIDAAVRRFPRLRIVASTLRDVHSANRHGWGAVALIDGQMYLAPAVQIDVYDRVGGGDGFAAGLFSGILAGCAPEEALKLGWAHGALLTTFPGDTTMATLEQVRALAAGVSARIER